LVRIYPGYFSARYDYSRKSLRNSNFLEKNSYSLEKTLEFEQMDRQNFLMIGYSSIFATPNKPWKGEGLPVNRTPWNPESHRVEFFSHPAEFSASLIRTQWKIQKARLGKSWIKINHYNYLNTNFPLYSGGAIRCAVIRTRWKMNSYLSVFFRPEFRTCWNSIRTGWQAGLGIIQEIPNSGAPINTFLFISKGDE